MFLKTCWGHVLSSTELNSPSLTSLPWLHSGDPPKQCVPFHSSQSTWRQQLQPSWAPAPWPHESQVPWRVLGYLSHVDSNLQIPSIVELSVRHDAAGEVTQNIRTEGRETTPLGVGIVECTVGHSMAPNWTECISCSMTKPPRTCAGIWGESKWRVSHLSLVTSCVKVAPNLLSLWDPKSINPQAPDINSPAWLSLSAAASDAHAISVCIGVNDRNTEPREEGTMEPHSRDPVPCLPLIGSLLDQLFKESAKPHSPKGSTSMSWGFFSIYNFLYLFLAVLGLCCGGFSLVEASGGYSLVAVCGLLIAEASLIVEHGLTHRLQ